MIGNMQVDVKCDEVNNCRSWIIVDMDAATWNRGIERTIQERDGWVCEDGRQFCCRRCRNTHYQDH